jgi:transposase
MSRPGYPSDITREEFDQVRPMLEAARRKTRPRKHDLYDVFCAVLHFLDSGAAWRSMPRDFPPWRTVHEYFTQWTLVRGDEHSLLERALEQVGRPAAIAQLRKRIGGAGEAPAETPADQPPA